MGKAIHDPVPQALEEVAAQVVEAGFRVHRGLGLGLLESVYEVCLCHELSGLGIPFERQVERPIEYCGVKLDAGLRIDLWIDRSIIVELKCVEQLLPVHKAQLLTHMKLTGSRLGFLMNFNTARLKDGIVRMIL